jgi:hypothetical protein
MKFLKTYKLFESSNQEDILFDLDDIIIDSEDSGFLIKKEVLLIRWFEYNIKNDKVIFDLTRWQTDEELELEQILNIRGFNFLFDVNLDNFGEIKSTLIRTIRYFKEINKSKFVWNTRIDYSYSENTDNMKKLFSAVNLTSLEDDLLNKLIDGLKIEGSSYSYEQVPKRIKINIYKD